MNGKRNGAVSDDHRDLEAFAREVDALIEKYKSKIGHEDVDFIERCFDYCDKSEIVGRLLIHFSLDPFTWLLGSTLLAYHMGSRGALMHMVHHGAYDNIPNVPSRFVSEKTKYNSAIARPLWKVFHVRHHAYSNQPEKDPDWGYGLLRWSGETKWYPFHLFQVPGMVLTTIGPFGGIMGWYAVFQSGFMEFFVPKGLISAGRFYDKHDWETFKKSFAWMMEGLGPYLAKNFLIYPALGGIFWPKVLLGNTLAHFMAGTVAWLHTVSAHIGQPVFEKKPGSRAEWYVQQIEGTANLKVESEIMRIFTAGNHQQIEHHVYSKFPVSRLWEMAPELEALCKKYGVRYTSESWAQRTKKVFKTLLKYSFPVS
ncbi:fatty acid desaturase [Sorangium sp. So ce296]|uniref:fatty acid desaturase family protein n=1 Tax=Sorangium sp. So ce296 TaxID=3133296 RepID=UPI003F609AF9